MEIFTLTDNVKKMVSENYPEKNIDDLPVKVNVYSVIEMVYHKPSGVWTYTYIDGKDSAITLCDEDGKVILDRGVKLRDFTDEDEERMNELEELKL